ncbi:MAG: phosphodiesterase [Ruminococcaceae bacterium]|nr:phosphodiesterase [Oscillospiraceae bacterium]MBQ8898677.1 phosphodiesterase [Clostridia bacterium]
MKWMIASDIHGSAYWCRRLIGAFEKENCQRLLLLGDILYHGPRNDLPRDYAPKEVIAMLEPLREKILCVRGNCDTEVDQMVLSFPILADYAVVPCENALIYATHGHKYGETNPPPLCGGDVLLCGHTHVPACREHEGFLYLNPGSVSIPKEGSAHGYMIFEDGRFSWRDIESGEEYLSRTL